MAIPSISHSSFTPPLYPVTTPVRGRPLAAPTVDPVPDLPVVGDGALPTKPAADLRIAGRNGEVPRSRTRRMANSFGSFFGSFFSCGSSG